MAWQRTVRRGEGFQPMEGSEMKFMRNFIYYFRYYRRNGQSVFCACRSAWHLSQMAV